MSGQSRTKAAQNTGRLKVLVLDEFKYMRSLVASMLDQSSGHIVAVPADGMEQALDNLDRFQADIVITDWNMKFIRRVRHPETSPNPFVPIIMLTGHAEVPLVIQARDAGVNEFLAKPVSAKALQSRIHAVIHRPRAFIRSSAYFGPDRRRRDIGPLESQGGERRRHDPLAAPESPPANTRAAG